MATATPDDVARALQRWREVTAPLSHARNDRDAQLMLAASAIASPSKDRGEAASAQVNAWSHREFVRRVATFSVATWFAKPLCISPLACARFGWENSARDLLTCAHCTRVLCFKIDDKLSAKGAEAVAAQFARQLETSHDAACPWSHSTSPESFTMLPLLGPSQVAQDLRERTEALVAHVTTGDKNQHALRELHVSEQAKHKLLDAAGVDEAALKMTLTKSQTSNKSTDERTLLNAALVSACGWVVQDKKQDESDKDATAATLVLSCEFCNRHVPLPATPEPPTAAVDTEESKSEDEDERSTTPPAKRQRVDATTSSKPIDPIAEHRWFCPWVIAQRRRDAKDDERIRDVMARVTSDQVEPTGESLAEFVALPGWRQCALAFRHLEILSDRATISEAATTNVRSSAAHVSALDALESVQSVLSLPDTYN